MYIRFLFLIRLYINSKMSTNNKLDKSKDIIPIYKMAFIYNALMNGWSVRYLDNNKFEFVNKDEEIKKEFFLENFLDNFIDKNLDINNILHMQKT